MRWVFKLHRLEEALLRLVLFLLFVLGLVQIVQGLLAVHGLWRP